MQGEAGRNDSRPRGRTRDRKWFPRMGKPYRVSPDPLRRFVYLLIVMWAISALSTAVTAALLYRTGIAQERNRLRDVVRSQARLMEAVARFDRRNTEGGGGRAFDATLSQVRDAHGEFLGFGNTGEFVVARREEDEIVFLVASRNLSVDSLRLPLHGVASSPMSRALVGQSGTMIGPDYRGVTVLAAYEPVTELNVGLVAKIDIAELRAPYVRMGLLVAGVVLLLLGSGSGLFRYFAKPIQKRQRVLAHEVAYMFQHLHEALGVVDSDGRFVRVNEAFATLLGYGVDELIGMSDEQVFSDNTRRLALLQQLREQGSVSGFEADLRRKDGIHIACRLSVTALSADGSIEMYLGIVRDLSEERRLARLMADVARQERTQIGRDLHDTLGQTLTAIGMLLAKLHQQLEDGESVSADAVVSVEQLVKRATRETRLMAQSLLVGSAEPQELEAELKDLAGLIEELYHVSCTFRSDRAGRTVNAFAASHLYRIAQEAATNAVRHGRADTITIELRSADRHVELTVEDNGEGFEPTRADRGLGLRIMENRATVIGGSLDLERAPDGGTIVRCVVAQTSP